MSEKCCEHVISFHWHNFKPIVNTYNAESNRIRQLSFDPVNFTISNHRFCVGRCEEGVYIPCRQHAGVSKNSVCANCSPPDIPIMGCVFEPRCHGDLCGNPAFCTQPHVVYLAIYGNMIKVGMTSEKRFSERIIEQGADSAAPIFHCSDRWEARNLEKEISVKFKIPQEIRPQKLMKQWITPPSVEQMKMVYKTYLNKISLWQEPIDGELQIFDRYPILARPRSPPKIIQSAGRHQGRLLGIKGRFMAYITEKGPVAINLSDVVGREICTSTDYSSIKETLNIQ